MALLLLLAGEFALGQAHTWVTQLLPGTPPHPPPGEGRVSYTFVNCQVKSRLLLQYTNNQVLGKR